MNPFDSLKRGKFIRTCCYSAISIPVGASLLHSCSGIYYAQSHYDQNKLIVSKNEFVQIMKNRTIERDFVLIKNKDVGPPICLYKTGKNQFSASLLKCTHRGCELNVVGPIYSCPCHGSEFSSSGKVLEGPATEDLMTYKTEITDDEIFIFI